MDSDPNENISLPEAYLCPSKKLLKVNSKNKGNIWKESANTCMGEGAEGSSVYSNSIKSGIDTQRILRKQQKHLFSSERRGETPGSDAPSNSPPPLGGLRSNFVLSIEPPEENVGESESDSFIWTPKSGTGSYPHLSQRRSVEGADSNGEIPSLTSQQSNISAQDFQEMQYMQRNSPAGVSTPEVLSNTTNTDIEGATSSQDLMVESVRPPALGQSEDILQTFVRKDLGSTDGEDSSHESIKQLTGKSKKIFVEGCSVGSQSENTDSTNTVLDLKREPIQGCEDVKVIGKQSNNLTKPHFIVGGAISPRTGINMTQKGCLLDLEKSFPSELPKDPCKLVSTLQSSPEQDESLTSKISVESTHHPESTECITSSSVISVSSIASSKKLEWDSGADVGYSGKVPKEKPLTSSLSTLERIAIGNYASVLRAEPEGKGTSQVKGVKAKASKRSSNTHKEHKLSRFSENKPGFSIRKSASKDYYSLNYNRHGPPDYARKSLSTDEETLNPKRTNSPRRRMKKPSSTNESHSEIAQNMGNYTKHNHSRYLSSKKKAYSLSELATSKAYNLNDLHTNQAESEVLVKNLISTENSDSANDKSNSNSLSLPSYTTFKSVLQTTNATLHQFQPLDSKMCSEKLESTALPESLAKVDDKELSEVDCSQASGIENQPRNSSSSESVNRFLFALSKKLNSYVYSLIDNGVVEKVDDYNKLQDYIKFVGMPSTNEEEVKLKKSVADIILRMFGDINAQEIDSSSSTFNTDDNNTENNLSHSSLMSYNSESKTPDKGDTEEEGVQDKLCLLVEEASSKLKENLVFVPYRPPSATRTYYMAVPGEEFGDVELLGELPSRFADEESHPTCKEEALSGHSERNERHLSYMGVSDHNARDVADEFEEETKSDHSSLENQDGRRQFDEKRFSELPLVAPSTSKGLYQDWHGTYHVAHQPPGYSSCVDSHQSESTSDNEPRKASRYHPQEASDSPSVSGPLNLEGGRSNRPPVWSSTGSESAYETIRERHRNVGESLASSFEFYSTSPRDARLLGYVSDDSPKPGPQEEQLERKANPHEEDFRSRVSEVPGVEAAAAAVAVAYRSSDREESSSSYATSSYSSQKPQRKGYKKSRSYKKPPSGTTARAHDHGSDRLSTSSTSLIQVKKQQYVKKITKYIDTLEKLERTLMPSCENLLDGFLPEDDSLRFKKVSSNRKTRHRPLEDTKDTIGSNHSAETESNLNSFTSKSSSVGADQSSFVVHRLSTEKRSEDTSSSSEKRKDSSRYVLPSRSSREDSPQSTLSSSGKEDSHSTLQSSGSERPKKTSTLREENKKKMRRLKKSTHRSPTECQKGLEGVGQISDFRKPMASNSVSDEIRPYRFLLQRAERRAALDIEKEKTEVVDSKFEENCADIGAKERLEDSEPHRDKEVEKSRVVTPPIPEGKTVSSQQRNSPLKGKEQCTEQPLSQSLSSPGVDSDLFDFAGSRTEEKPKSTRNIDICPPDLGDSAVLDRHSPIGSVSLPPASIDPVVEVPSKKEFGQMFPSESFLNIAEDKRLLSVSIQTGESLLQLNSNEETTPEVSNEEATPEVEDSVPPESNEVGGECVAGAGCSPTHHQSSALEEIQARIKRNAEKINAAISLYNKKFPFPIRTINSRPSVPKPSIRSVIPVNTQSDNDSVKDNDNQVSNTQESESDSVKDHDNQDSKLLSLCSSETVPSSATENHHDHQHQLNNNQTSAAEVLQPKGPSVIEKTKERTEEVDENLDGENIVTPRRKAKKKALKFTVTMSEPKKESSRLNKSLVEELLELNKEKEIMTLQEALSLARPKYLKEAEKRRMKICKKRAIRQKVQSHNQDALAELPDSLKTPTIIQKFVYKPEESPLFSYKTMRQQNRRLYQLLPEAHTTAVLKRKNGINKANRIIANFYSKKLQRKTLKGKVSHTHQQVLTPIH